MKIREASGSDRQAHEAAVEAVQQVLPLLSQKEASAEAVNAVAYATKYHSDRFWKGAQHARKWRRRTSPRKSTWLPAAKRSRNEAIKPLRQSLMGATAARASSP